MLLSFATGCFAVNDPERHLPQEVAAADFCPRFAEIYCESALDCCAPVAGNPPEDIQNCYDRFTGFCNEGLAPLINDPRTGYDGAEAARSLSFGFSLADRCDPEFFRWLGDPDGLLSFPGTVEAGGECDPRAGEDPSDTQSARFFSCVDGLACIRGADSWTCSERIAEGELCESFGACAEGLYCGFDADSGENRCEPREADGAPCYGDAGCASGVCQGVQLAIAEPTGRCVPSEQTYCDERDGCGNVAFFGDAGPLFEGFACDAALVCATPAIADTLRARSWYCQANPPGGENCPGTPFICFYDDNGALPVVGPGMLDFATVRELCEIGEQLSATMDVLVCSST